MTISDWERDSARTKTTVVYFSHDKIAADQRPISPITKCHDTEAVSQVHNGAARTEPQVRVVDVRTLEAVRRKAEASINTPSRNTIAK